MISVDEALAIILEKVRPLGPERVLAEFACGRVLAESIVATGVLPAWDNSAMDGYCVRAADVTTPDTRLRVSDEIPAGDRANRPLEPGTAARIFTGAPMPPGADTVIMQEDTERTGDQVTIQIAAKLGSHIRRAGTDVPQGETILRPGRVLTPGDIGLLAAFGRSYVSVIRAPIVALASSGDELVEVDRGPPGHGQIINGNSVALAAALRELGAHPRALPIIPDNLEATFEAIGLGAASADALITTGGVSVGDYDFVGQALQALGGDAFAFWNVSIKPGKPLSFGLIDKCAAFGLPGNPVSALVTFEVFVRPALLRMMGHVAVLRRTLSGRLVSAVGQNGGRTSYLRATAHRNDAGELLVDPGRTQSSGAVSSLAGADALIIIEPHAEARRPGDRVDVMLLKNSELG